MLILVARTKNKLMNGKRFGVNGLTNGKREGKRIYSRKCMWNIDGEVSKHRVKIIIKNVVIAFKEQNSKGLSLWQFQIEKRFQDIISKLFREISRKSQKHKNKKPNTQTYSKR